MGSTRQIFSEDRPSPGVFPDRMDQHTGDSSDYQILGMMKFKTNKEDIWTYWTYWTILKSGKFQDITQNWTAKLLHWMKTWKNFVATFLDISTAETFCCSLSNNYGLLYSSQELWNSDL